MSPNFSRNNSASAPFSIDGRLIGIGQPVYIIAEISANHNGSFDAAVELIHEAKRVGADAVKLQTYTPDTLTIDCKNEFFKIGKGTIWEGRTLHDLYSEAYTPWDWQPKLKAIADELELTCFSSPFDASSVDFLEAMEVPAYKIASFEIVDLALIEKVASTGKPIIMSTGMASYEEIQDAVQTVEVNGGNPLALLKCTSAYPAPASDMHLRTIPHLAEGFGYPVGLSDHTVGTVASVAAVSMGASIIEKHFTLSRDDPGPDSAFSLEPREFEDMVHTVRELESALGRVGYGATEKEMASRVFRRSLFVVEDVAEGESFTETNVRSIRPGNGLAPKHLLTVLGSRAARAVSRGTPVDWSMVDCDPQG